MTRGTPVLLALCLTLLLSACSGADDAADDAADGGANDGAGGNGSAVSSSPPSASAGSAPPSASSAPPPPVDLAAVGPAAATRINLQIEDLPEGFVASPPVDPGAAVEEAASRKVAECVGLPYVKPAVLEPSESFTAGSDFPILQYISQVEFYTDEATVMADQAANEGEKVGGCVAKQFQQQLAGSGSGDSYDPIVVTRLNPQAPGADGAFGLRFATTSTDGATEFTYDVLGFSKDRTEITLNALAFGIPPNDSQRDALFADLVKRGVANAL